MVELLFLSENNPEQSAMTATLCYRQSTLSSEVFFLRLYAPTAHLPRLHLALQSRAALVRGDVVNQGLHVWDGANWQQIDSENYAPTGHVLCGNLTPPTGGSAQIDADLRRAEKVILLVDLCSHTGARQQGATKTVSI